ncbi:MAG: glucose-1-phosphate adenylyltransferase [Herpetosiphonaceae bacterium]|nr:glucose-1-phosphate adenylyltransferase [Herpetosiphonaceae bacterium]
MGVQTLILAGGEGSRLSILGEQRAKPAVPFAGKYRIIDFALSNCVNSDLFRIAVLTQYRPHSLMEHIGIGEPWDLDRRRPDGVQIWQPYRGRNAQDWYRGTADALYQNISFLDNSPNDLILVLSGDHIYKMDYRPLLQQHSDSGAELTVAVMHVKPEEVNRFGIMSVNDEGRITEFREKPEQSESTLASMGIYVFTSDFLVRRLEEDAADSNSAHDFGKNIIPAMVEHDRVFAYPFEGYWVDVGTIPAYWETNLELLQSQPALDLHATDWVIHTRSEERPSVKFGAKAEVQHSLISNGCIIHGTVINSILSPGVIVARGAVVRDSIIMNATRIGEDAQIEAVIADKEVAIGAGSRIGGGDDMTPNKSEPRNISDGITVIGKGAELPAKVMIGRNCRIDSGVRPSDLNQLEIKSGETISPRM